MINPSKITNYNLTHPELEEHLLFWVFAANNNAMSASNSLDKFLAHVRMDNFVNKIEYTSPYNEVKIFANRSSWESVIRVLTLSRWRFWKTKNRAVKELCFKDLDLKTCTVENLESIWGIGPKTARCFLMHSRKEARIAGLDTHVLKFLRDQGIDAPFHTPSNKKRYRELEEEFLKLCDEVNKSPAEYDLEIWNTYREGEKIVQ